MAKTKRKKTRTYNRRGWWPDGWSVEKIRRGFYAVMDVDTGLQISQSFGPDEAAEAEHDAETLAVMEGDMLAARENAKASKPN